MYVHSIEKLFPVEYKKTGELCAEFFYRYERYSANFTMAMLYSYDPLDASTFLKAIRESDKLLQLNKNLFCLVFDMTNQENGLKACENLLAVYEAEHFAQKIYASLVNAEEFSTKEAMESRLFALLNYAIKGNSYNQITDDFYE